MQKVHQRLEKIQANNYIGFYSIIFVDLNLGDSNGFLLAADIRNIIKDVKTIIIAVTGEMVDEKMKRDLLKSGVNDVLPKPCSREQLGEVLKKYGVKGKE